MTQHITLKSEQSCSCGMLIYNEDPFLYQDTDKTEDILSEGCESRIEYEQPKPLSLRIGHNKVGIKICRSEPAMKVLFEENISRLEN